MDYTYIINDGEVISNNTYYKLPSRMNQTSLELGKGYKSSDKFFHADLELDKRHIYGYLITITIINNKDKVLTSVNVKVTSRNL